MTRFLLLLLLPILAPALLFGQVSINEIQSSNSNTIADEDGEYEDWIELYNDSDSAVDLTGYGLSDDYDNPYRWTLPSVTIQPGEFLLIWASGKDRTEPNSPLHTNFSIQRDGEEVLLTTPDGERVDEIEPTPIPRDNSFGRVPDGSGEWVYFADPTPGSENNTEPFSGLSYPPEFSHEGGQYTGSLQLELTADDGAEIYYTTDRTEPTTDTANRYTGPISIDRTTVVMAKTINEDALPSDKVTHLYTLLGGSTPSFDSNLPVMILSEFGNEIVPNDRSPAYLTVLEGDDINRAELTSSPDLQTFVMANKRGSSSLSFPKNMFSFHMIDEDGSNLNESLLGLPPEHNWILYAPYTDATLMRNVVSYGLSEQLGWYAPRTKFVELYLHPDDGPLTDEHYYGVYVLTERIKWDDNRVNITKLTPGDKSEPEISGGYIIKKDRLNEGESGLRTRRGTHLAYARPNEMDVTSAQHQWITDYVSDFEDALFGPDFTDPNVGYEAYINTESFIDHFLITELLKEIDGYRLSTFMYKDRGGKLIMGPLWDFNLSLGIADYLDGWKPDGWYYPLPKRDNECFVGCTIVDWYERLMEDPEYWERTKERWWELRQNKFSKDHLASLINENRELLDEAQVRNFERWPHSLGEHVWPNWYVGDTYDDEVDWMKQWLMDRVDWIDSQMGDPPSVPETETLHFWTFDDDLDNNTPFETLTSSYSSIPGGLLEYNSSLTGYPFEPDHLNWRKASMERRNRPTPLNYKPELFDDQEYVEEDMRALQVRQPFENSGWENSMIFHLPTDNSNGEGFLFRFAAKDENAADYLKIDYSVDGADQWTNTEIEETEHLLTPNYQLFEVDFTDIHGIENNPDFKIRIRFGGLDMEADEGDRVTFNNISFEQITGYSGLPDIKEEVPHMATLDQNYPNPFNATTTIRYGIPSDGFVELNVYNILGQRVMNLVNQTQSAGYHEAILDASGLSSGVYLYRLTTERSVETRKLMLVK